MKFPVVLKRPSARPPSAPLYYVVASNGVFQVRRTASYEAVTRACGPIPGLQPEEERLEFDWPPLGPRLIEDVLAFFLEVYRCYGAEAIVLLFYEPRSRRFLASAPPQRTYGSKGSKSRWSSIHRLTYQNTALPPGYLRFGTIHHHCALPAFASETDREDECADGLHIVFGNLDRPHLSVEAAFVANGVRFRLDPRTVLEAYELPRGRARRDWMAQVTILESRPVSLPPVTGMQVGYGEGAEISAEEICDGDDERRS
jgi:hypothetical protein